jgi:hypothetical protein
MKAGQENKLLRLLSQFRTRETKILCTEALEHSKLLREKILSHIYMLFIKLKTLAAGHFLGGICKSDREVRVILSFRKMYQAGKILGR